MRIVILGHAELASNLAISLVARRLDQHDLRICLSGEHGIFGETSGSVAELEDYESSLCARLDDEDVRARAAAAGLLSFTGLAQLCGKPIETLTAPNSPAALDVLAGWQPDLLVSMRYRRIFHAAAIAIPRRGVLNWHSGLLPEYRGVMATFRAMQRGVSDIGSTVHYISDKGIDTGSIIGRAPLTCDYSETYLSNVLRLYSHGYPMVVNAIEQVERAGQATCREQTGAPEYFRAPEEEDVAGFLRRGHRLFDGGELGRLLVELEQAAP